MAKKQKSSQDDDEDEPEPQLPGTMVAKYNGHKNVITKSKQKNRAYFWTIPFLVKYTGSKEK